MTVRGRRERAERARAGGALAALAACGALLTAACAGEGPPRGSLMVVVDTNVTPGRDFDVLRVRVQDDPATEIAYRYGWDEAAQRASVEDGGHLPFTVNVQNAGDTLAARKVSVTAWKAGAPVFARDAELVLPSAGTKALRLTVEALCFPPLAADDAKALAWPERDWAVSCAEGQTCFGGSCAPAHVDVNALEDYAPELVYGGASGPGQGGACVDVLGCFTRRAKEDGSLDEARLAQVVTPVFEFGACTLDVRGLSGRDDLTLAVEVPLATLGVCASNGCVTALDRVAEPSVALGWRALAGRLTLPKRLCELGARVLVRTQTDSVCGPKTAATPACGEATALGGAPREVPMNRRAEPLVLEGGGEAGLVCARLTASAELCGGAAETNPARAVQVACGEVQLDDGACGGRGRYAQCRGADETLACPSADTAGMKRIAGGAFVMGSTRAEVDAVRAYEDELPSRAVTVRDFWLDTTEVTAGAFEDWCAGPGSATPTCQSARRYDAPCTFKNGFRDRPMNCVSWYAASAYCAGQGKRLPTEEEWEYAARSGAKQYTYPWGNTGPSSAKLCWSGGGSRNGPCPVGSFPSGASEQGVQDLAGNVLEWTASRYGNAYDRPRTDAGRVDRGGCYAYASPVSVRAASRYRDDPAGYYAVIGFRCAR